MASTRPSSGTRGVRNGSKRLLAAAGLIALLGGLGAVVVGSRGADDGKPVVAPAVTRPAASPKPKPSPKQPAMVAVAVTGVGAYDPEGDRSENDGDAGLATDGDSGTAWKTEHYRRSFTKSGVGLVVDAGRFVSPRRVTVVTDTPGYRAQVRAGASPAGPFVAVSGTKVTTARTTFVLRPRDSRYLMLWVTSMPEAGTAAVNEITVAAAG